MKIAICSKILMDHDLEDAVRIAGEIGYEGIELFGFERHLPPDIAPARLDAVSEIARDFNMEIVCLAAYVGGYSTLSDREAQEQFELFKKYVEIAKKLNCKMIRQHPGGPSPKEATQKQWEQSAKWLGKVSDYCASDGLFVVLENHHGGLVETAESCLKLLGMAGAPNLKITYDPGNVFTAGADYGPDAIKRLGDAIVYVQVKDVSPGAEEMYPLLGEGQVDYERVIEGLRAINYKGYIAAECHRKTDDEWTSRRIAEHEFQALKVLLAQ